ncbi:MAG: DUF6088 family protein [Pseudomonadota bacterium]
MTQSVENKIISRIYGRGRGWAFTKTDFVAEFGEANIHQALSSLTKADKIRRVCRGVYDYPRYSELLGRKLSPYLDQVAHALARKFNWRIQPSGDTALNLLGLSTQVPGRWVYLSDGPGREYKVGEHSLVFKKSALKDVGFKYRESGLVVQALKALGREHVDGKVIEGIRRQMESKSCERILRDTRSVTGWIYETIKRICKGGD